MNPVFTTDVAVRWSDQDINRHVNNARVVTLIEEARLAALAHWLGPEGIPNPDQPRVVVSLHLDYLRPIDHGPQLTAQLKVAAVGRSSYTLDCDLIQYGKVAARTRTVLVQMDPVTGRSLSLPTTVRNVLAELRTIDADDAEGTEGASSQDSFKPAAAGTNRA